jgi:hypothetical protein
MKMEVFNIAMEHGHGYSSKIIYKWVAFHGYVKQPEGRFPFFLAEHVGKAMP